MTGFKHPFIKYRPEIFGFSTLMILMCHAVSIVPLPDNISVIVSYGGMGVNIFLFMSGIGLYYSLKRNGNIIDFYIRRAIRLIVPYLLIAGVWYGLKYIIIEKNFLLFIYELSLFSFWTEHKGAWYVAALIPLYLIYPLIFKWLDRGQEKLKIYSLILALILFMIFLSMMNEHLYNHLSQIIIGLISFFIGTIIAKK